MIPDRALNELRSVLVTTFGLPLNVQRRHSAEGELLELRPQQIESARGFRVEFFPSWRSIRGRFVPDSFAKHLLLEMSNSSREQRLAFCTFARALGMKGAEVVLRIDGINMSPVDPDSWPRSWDSIHFEFRCVGVELEKGGRYHLDSAQGFVLAFTGMVLALLPLEPDGGDMEAPSTEGRQEGELFVAQVNRYERNPLNRAACIEILGDSCLACGLDFSDRYGEVGKGFIHVHHIVPIASMGTSYALNPATDLVPVCPNCHAMLHRREPPLSIDELRALIVDMSNTDG